MVKQESQEEIMGKYEEVAVSGLKARAISVEPSTAWVFFNNPNKPDSVRWVFNGLPEGAVSVVIKWDVESPFQNFGAECHGDGRLVLIGTGNTGIEGLYRYSILFLDEKGQVVAGVDPEVGNDPEPPH